MAYNGKAENGMPGPASLYDPLPFPAYPGITHEVKVRDMMSTVSGMLGMCYQY